MVEAIKREVEKLISESVDKEIENRTIAFHKEKAKNYHKSKKC